MNRLGISIYPGCFPAKKDQAYLELVASYGFQRVFTCLLSLDHENPEQMGQLKSIISFANKLGLEVIVDVAPRVFSALKLSPTDLSLFHQWGVAGIRLDLGFTGMEEAMMTFNPYGLKIELNMSLGTKHVENILSYQPNKQQLTACHNFYPHRYTGLSYDHFAKTSSSFKELGLKTAAFVSSQAATIGPWPVMEGLCTLEMHRDLPVEIQAKHLFATGWIDDVLIGNAYASEEELAKLSRLTPEVLAFRVELAKEISPLEKKIVLEEPHCYRGDVSDYMIRSTLSRVKYREESFALRHTRPIRRGDILIDNEHYGQYKGELQIALKPMENRGKTNVVGRILEEELFLLEYLKPWSRFRFEQ
ncbi:DUF871 domain-containing protein [Thermoactinomyces mirandus]|uniref:DUF871 domain-containing protein n=1 Tax=Thermoactinomyces mirandus TaxID=2756294 RepID=A0A7W2ATK6_9BACL|nr:MupG family TIM beta-alpha barrel fold protein [Thermoactinomyces mirandus]MBA4603860.1 DUF871 domain-containing protein [Thermoactinomyces mirandus]